MTDYTKSTNFATKDSLPPGSALKIVRGTEIDTEFNAIATAVATKVNTSDIGTTVQAYDADLTTLGAGGSAARSFLGLAIGTNVQAWDADLDTWAGKTAPTGTVVGTSDTQTLTNKTLTTPAISGNVNMTGGTKYQVSGTATNALAWVNWNGTDGSRRSSYNVSSVTRSSTGVYTVNFATALSDANYSFVTGLSMFTGNYTSTLCIPSAGTPTTTSIPLTAEYWTSGGTVFDPTYASVAIFGN